MTKAAIAAGADGLLIEVHPDPKSSLSDGAQTLRLDTFTQLMKELSPIVQAVGRELGTSVGYDLERIKNQKNGVYCRDAAKLYKEKISVPVILVGGIRSYELAKELVEKSG